MRIAYVVSRFPKITETFVLYEALELRRRGFDVDIYPLQRVQAAVRHDEIQQVEPSVRFLRPFSLAVLGANLSMLLLHPGLYLGTLILLLRHTLGSARFFLGALAFFPQCVAYGRDLRSTGADRIHAHFANHPALAALAMSRFARIPYSFTAHGSDLHVDQTGLALKVEWADFVVTVSEYNRRFITERVGAERAEKIRVVHCGVDPEVFESLEPPEGDGGPLRIACVASLRAVKGHRHLLEACRLLRERGVAFECHLAGDGPLRREVEEGIRIRELGAHVTVHGDLARTAIVELLGNSDVITLPSVLDRKGRREGIPVSLMEGMARGLPVVASRISGIPELVDHGTCGFLVEPGDGAGLAEAFEQLAGDPEQRRSMGRAARNRILQDFDLRKNAAQLASLFQPGAPDDPATLDR